MMKIPLTLISMKFNDNTLIRRLGNQIPAYNKDNNNNNSRIIGFFGHNKTINQIIQFNEYKLRLLKQNKKDLLQNKEKNPIFLIEPIN